MHSPTLLDTAGSLHNSGYLEFTNGSNSLLDVLVVMVETQSGVGVRGTGQGSVCVLGREGWREGVLIKGVGTGQGSVCVLGREGVLIKGVARL